MGKKILIISGSPRKNGNSEALCDRFAAGAAENGNQVEKVWLGNKKLHFCTGCHACQVGECPHRDDAVTIGRQMLEADVIVLSTPVYFYSMTGQLKTLIDRSIMYYPQITGKKFFFIMTMADKAEKNFKGTIEALKGFVDCCEDSSIAGMICASGVYEKGEVNDTAFMTDAYVMGKTIR